MQPPSKDSVPSLNVNARKESSCSRKSTNSFQSTRVTRRTSAGRSRPRKRSKPTPAGRFGRRSTEVRSIAWPPTGMASARPMSTPEQFAMARWVFSTFSAIAVALAGSVAALVYYARNRVSGGVSFLASLVAKIARARRAYYARKRRPLKIEVPGPEPVIHRDGKEPPIVVEKEVVRWIDRIILIPRWGIRVPFHVNSIIGKDVQSPRALRHDSEDGAVVSNVMPIKKAN
jgi:hypothetical protein